MKNSAYKKLVAGLSLGLGVILLTGCTQNFCSQLDQAAMAYPYDQGVTVYCTEEEYNAWKANNPVVASQEEEWSDQAVAHGLPRIAGKALDGNDNVYKYIPVTPATVTKKEGEVETTRLVWDNVAYNAIAAQDSVLLSTLQSASNSNIYVPSAYYFGVIDDYTLKAAICASAGKTGYKASADYQEYFDGDANFKAFVASLTAHDDTNGWAVSAYDKADTNGVRYFDYAQNAVIKADDDHPIKLIETQGIYDGTNKGSVLHFGGKMKFTGKLGDSGKEETRELWGFYDAWNNEIAGHANDGFAPMSTYALPSSDFIAAYKSSITSKVNSIRSCIATRDDYFGHYGATGEWRVAIQKKDWGYAWSKGFLEGLLVFPVAWMVDTFAYGMDPALTGTGQILALIFVTLIVRGLLVLISFRSTMSTQKMQALQPELAKIQAKYPNSNTNQAEKQRLGQEQMALYRRHKINPFGQLIVLVFQFPIFISVWSGLQGSAAMSTGAFLNMRLSDTIQSILFNVKAEGWYLNATGWWTALVLFILMAGTQIMSMVLPRLFQKRMMKKTGKLTKNPAQDSQNKTMKWVSIGMMGFTIVMGFMLPSAMGVYWLITGVISMIQTTITQLILQRSKKKGK